MLDLPGSRTNFKIQVMRRSLETIQSYDGPKGVMRRKDRPKAGRIPDRVLPLYTGAASSVPDPAPPVADSGATSSTLALATPSAAFATIAAASSALA